MSEHFLKGTLLIPSPCSTEISLKQRLEYIARAILSAKSSSCVSAQASDGEFLHELEEKMEVCVEINIVMEFGMIPQLIIALSLLNVFFFFSFSGSSV